MAIDPNAARTVRVRGRLFFSVLVIALIGHRRHGRAVGGTQLEVVVGQPRRAGQLALLESRPDHEVQREPARGRVVLSRTATPASIPIAVDDVIYMLGRNNSLIALDATTGKEIWIHENLAEPLGRGINYWQSADGSDKRLLLRSTAFLQAIDARTGKSIMTLRQQRLRRSARGAAQRRRHGIRVHSESRARSSEEPAHPRIGAGRRPGLAARRHPRLRRVTGKRLWQFHTVPEPGEFGYETWPKDAYKYVGGANTWGEMSIDEERGIVYLPTGSRDVRLLRRRPPRRESVRQLSARARRAHGQASLALPDDSSRPLGPGQRLGAAARHGPAQRAAHRRRRARRQDGLPLRLQSRDRRAALADRRAAGAARATSLASSRGRRSRSRRNRRRSARQSFTVDDVESVAADEPEEYRTLRARVAKARNGTGQVRRIVHSARRRRGLDVDAGQSGRIELGHDGRES